ncbi:uncharacterized protein BKA55DRAFT_553733 [Fusarium redolens]|uniref:Uncharacterized protein n=1 Tax=Fusarium redolens TaxID=48865 RepID=A0A9P9KR04_FUSRE|nr:uncharacterized protein BKA55DRAFT_553733 [Fusarium redolens]KAH7266924.1 hypothetical protein BKA55DRAFT_553733 [Fusarium redolens]
MRDLPVECIDRNVCSTNSGLSFPPALRELRAPSRGDRTAVMLEQGKAKSRYTLECG